MLKVQLLTQWKDILVCVCVNWKSGWAPNELKVSVCMGMGRLVVWVREVSLLNACEQDQGQGEPAPT